MKKKLTSPRRLDMVINLLTARIQDINNTMSHMKESSSKLHDLRKKRKRYIDSLKRATQQQWEIEFEAQQAAELLKMIIPEYIGMPCADYLVPNDLIKHCKLPPKEE